MKDKVMADLCGKNILKTQYNRFIVWGLLWKFPAFFHFHWLTTQTTDVCATDKHNIRE
jgi:hypothetical protein